MAQEHTYRYTIFYSSRDASGHMWCPDCRRVEATLASVFGQADGPQAEVVYVTRPDWKNPSNTYRQAPFHVTSVPTVLKFSAHDEIVARIQDDDILDEVKLGRFLKQA